MKSENAKWYRIANALDVTPDLELFELRKSFHTYLSYEPIIEIWESKEYKSLTKGQSGKIVHWLSLEGDFNQHYDFFKGGDIWE
jgi:hypothetical protein